MNRKSKKMWQITALLAVDLILLILISTVSARAEMLGSSGERVARIQHELQKKNLYQGKENGIFDFETKRAIAEFQRLERLGEDAQANHETLCALGLDSSSSECFSACAELIARCITLSGCRTYPEMLNMAELIAEKTDGAVTLGKYISELYPDFLSEDIEPSDKAYSAAVQVIRKSAHLGGTP